MSAILNSVAVLFVLGLSFIQGVEEGEYMKIKISSYERKFLTLLALTVLVTLQHLRIVNIPLAMIALIVLYCLIAVQDYKTTVVPFSYTLGILFVSILGLIVSPVLPPYMLELIGVIIFGLVILEFIGDKININFGLADIEYIWLSTPILYLCYYNNPNSIIALAIGISVTGILTLLTEAIKMKKQNKPIKEVTKMQIPFCHILSVGYILAIITGTGDWFI